jgi:RNA polymerase primary sigma factor
MPRTRGADSQRNDTTRRRGQHGRRSTTGEHVERRREAHRVAAETTDSFQLFVNEASRYPLLTREEEVELAQRIERGDLEAKERLINSNLRLVIKFASRYQGHGLPLQDLIQEAMLGLIRAAEKFDWRRGYKFSTYAVLWIKQSIQRGLDNTGRPVRIPAHIAQRERTVNRTLSELSAKLNREPTEEEIAAQAKLPLEEVKAVRDLTRVTTSLDAPVGEDGDTTLGELHGGSTASVEEEVLDNDREATIKSALATLPDEERRVIQLRFGTDGEPATVRGTARELGISEDRARHLEARGLKRLADDDSLSALRDAA